METPLLMFTETNVTMVWVPSAVVKVPVPFDWMAFGTDVPSSVMVGFPNEIPVHRVTTLTVHEVAIPLQVTELPFAGESMTICGFGFCGQPDAKRITTRRDV